MKRIICGTDAMGGKPWNNVNSVIIVGKELG